MDDISILVYIFIKDPISILICFFNLSKDK